MTIPQVSTSDQVIPVKNTGIKKPSQDTIVIHNITLINNSGNGDTLYAEYDSTGKLIKVILNK